MSTSGSFGSLNRERPGNWVLVFNSSDIRDIVMVWVESQDIGETRRYRGARLRECRKINHECVKYVIKLVMVDEG